MKTRLFLFTLMCCSGLYGGAKEDGELMREKCSQCHSLSQAFTLQGRVLPSEIAQLVRTMSGKPKANINAQQRDQIISFLIYYVVSKKQSSLKRDLEALPKEKQEAEMEKIKHVLAQYQ